jgi:hypothetical protein
MKSIWFVALVVLALLAPVGAAQAVEVNPDWGSVTGKSRAMKQGCRDYRYTYEVTAPENGDWDLNVDLVDPNGRVVWFGYLSEGANPAVGTSTFRLCRSKAPRGRYKLKATVSNQLSNEVEAFRLPTSRFRLS